MEPSKLGGYKGKGMNKILLISPNAEGLEDKMAYPPLGLLYVASNMGDDWEPEIKIMTDDNFTEFNYPYYGISVHSVAVINKVNALVKRIKEINREAVIFLGGAAARMAETDRDHVLVINGEFEQYVTDTSDLDNIKLPARHLVPYKNIHYTGTVHHTTEPSTTMIATRGCVYDCKFCDRETFGRKFRKRSIGNVCLEVRELAHTYGIKWIRFCDDCVTLDRKWFMELCGALWGYGMKWTCMSRADLLDPEMLATMKRAGCQEIFFGFESGSQKILDGMNKRATVDKYREALQMCRDAGIKSCAYIMFGFPGEDERTVEETIQFLQEARPDKSRLSEFVPFPGCDVGNNPEKYGVELKNNGKDYWYYDNKELSLRYKYMSDEKMLKLREIMRGFFNATYKQSWALQ